MINTRAISASSLVVTALLAVVSPVLAVQSPNVSAITIYSSASSLHGAPVAGTELGGKKQYLADVAPLATTTKSYGPDLHEMKPACHTGTFIGVVAASQVVNALVVSSADNHQATQRVTPYGQPRSPLLPVAELAAEDFIISKAMGWTHTSCNTQKIVWSALSGAAIINSASTTSGTK